MGLGKHASPSFKRGGLHRTLTVRVPDQAPTPAWVPPLALASCAKDPALPLALTCVLDVQAVGNARWLWGFCQWSPSRGGGGGLPTKIGHPKLHARGNCQTGANNTQPVWGISTVPTNEASMETILMIAAHTLCVLQRKM